MTFPYRVEWHPAKTFREGRSGHVVLAIIHHRMVGTLPGTDAYFAGPNRPVSTHFGVGHDPWPNGPVRFSQYVDLEDEAFANGNWDPSGSWPFHRDGVNPNDQTVSIEHEDNGHLPKSDRRKGIVTEDIIEASIALDRLLLSGDLDAIRKAGIRCGSAAVARQLGRITPKAGSTIANHHDIAGKLKPYCWRPWAYDERGFPAARYVAALTAAPAPEAPMSTVNYRANQFATLKDGAELYDAPGGKLLGKVQAPLDRLTFGTNPGGGFRLVEADFKDPAGVPDRTAWVKKEAIVKLQVLPPGVDPEVIRKAEAQGRKDGLIEAEAAVRAIPR